MITLKTRTLREELRQAWETIKERDRFLDAAIAETDHYRQKAEELTSRINTLTNERNCALQERDEARAAFARLIQREEESGMLCHAEDIVEPEEEECERCGTPWEHDTQCTCSCCGWNRVYAEMLRDHPRVVALEAVEPLEPGQGIGKEVRLRMKSDPDQWLYSATLRRALGKVMRGAWS
jgi:hypothetical protein